MILVATVIERDDQESTIIIQVVSGNEQLEGLVRLDDQSIKHIDKLAPAKVNDRFSAECRLLPVQEAGGLKQIVVLEVTSSLFQ